jgi:PTH2 family peptidyl-tRNA hydrolase
MKEPKQVIVIRKDLNMRKGKQISQGSHASLKVFLDRCDKNNNNGLEQYTFNFEPGSAWDKWLNGRFTKIVVSCDSEQELNELYRIAKNNNLPCVMIVDAGLTEFNGVPTETCIAIGPADPDEIDKITKHLKLL